LGMKATCTLILLVLICHTFGDLKNRFDGYKVLRIYSNDGLEVLKTAENLLADVWAANRREGWIDVMVSPMQLPAFQRFNTTVHVEDVQKLIDENEEERRKSAKEDDFFSDFQTNDIVVEWVNEQISLHPNIAKLVNIGETYLGTDMLGIHLGEETKPLVYIHCCIHAREWITVSTCCWIIDNLLNKDSDGPKLIEDYQWIIVPVFNIDGYDYTHTTDRLWRKNRLPNPGSSCVGTDVNRNYGYQWSGPGSSANPCSETFHGTAPWSCPESLNERNFLEPYIVSNQLAIYFDIHSFSAYFMSAWGFTVNLPPDYGELDLRMNSAVEAIASAPPGRTYDFGTTARVLYLMSGGTVDYTYERGVLLSFLIEVYGLNFTPPPSFIQPIGEEIWAGVKQVVVDNNK